MQAIIVAVEPDIVPQRGAANQPKVKRLVPVGTVAIIGRLGAAVQRDRLTGDHRGAHVAVVVVVAIIVRIRRRLVAGTRPQPNQRPVRRKVARVKRDNVVASRELGELVPARLPKPVSGRGAAKVLARVSQIIAIRVTIQVQAHPVEAILASRRVVAPIVVQVAPDQVAQAQHPGRRDQASVAGRVK